VSDQPSVAENRWREFEKLAVELVEDGFRIKPDVVRVTRPSKDGGIDGYIDLILANGLGGSIRHRTLVEAKLRSRAGGVGLGTVAATMVVAYNEAAQSLFLVTNGSFTSEALEHISVFLAKTNLAVHLVDGRTVAGWVRRNLCRLRISYSPDLLDLLVLPEGESEAAHYIECRRRDLLRDWKDRGRIFDPPTVKVKTGWLENGRMADCRAILEWAEVGRDVEALPALVGRKRHETVERLVRTLEARSGVAILAGPPGVGKSIVLDHIVAQSTASPEDVFSFSFVDVGRSLTSRGLFLDILAACSGIDYRIIYSDARDAIDPEYLVARTAGRETPKAVKLAVANVLRESVSGFQSSRDLSWQPLLDFLQEVATPHARRRKTTVIFQELNRASSECLEFLVKGVQRLESAGMRVVVELRDRGSVPDSATRSSQGDHAIMSLREWEGFVQTFLRLQTCGVYRVDPLDQRETHEYLERLLPGLGPERAEVVRTRLGGIPLHLKSAAVWLETERVVDRHGGELPVVEQLETFFEGIRPDHVEGLFDQLIEAWWRRPSCPLRNFLAAAALLDGCLRLQVLEILRGEESLDCVVEQLVDSTLFDWSRQAHDQLEVSHDLLRERISHFAGRQRLAQRQVAERLLPHVEELWADPLLRKLRKVDLLDALGRWEEVQELSFRVGTELSQANELTSASKYLTLAHEALRKLSQRDPIADTDRSHEEVEILSALLEVDVKRRRIGLDTNQRRLDVLDVLLTHLRGVVESVRWQEFWLQKLLFRWNHHFLREEFASAADLAEKAREFVLAHDSGVPPALAGQAWTALGLTYKVLNKRARSMQIFDEAVKRFPDLERVRAERLSNLAAFALRDDPARALKLYQEILESEGEHADLHTRVDVGMAWFLMGDYKNARSEGELALRLAADRGVPAQEARARNILACCLWAGAKTEEADRQFDLASVAAERTMFRRYLWRIRVNRSGTAWEIGQAGVAYSLARSAEEDILVPRENSFAEVGDSSEHITSRWYAALLAIGERYQHLGKPADYRRLCDRVRLPYFEEHLEAWTSGASVPDALSGTSHLHSGRIMITG
jgi:tetratricopeptide (TPR) repeat protein